MAGSFAHDTFGCFDDIQTCLITYFVPCYTAGKNAESVGESCCIYGCVSVIGPCGIYTRAKIREKIREKYNIGDKEANKFLDGFAGDCLCHWACGLCSLIQEAQEIKDRGDKPADGVTGTGEPYKVSIERE